MKHIAQNMPNGRTTLIALDMLNQLSIKTNQYLNQCTDINMIAQTPNVMMAGKQKFCLASHG